ncbi:uncharacterized protein BP5553_10417 [Venustampulla echinocandica]|uniref:Argonaute linker 1 domain-containing protein n=1 Tax=Venustampulla echinocandica TaxID=2656787 RepID=A0A370T9A4_9HELO|nr:uncharacterized protein BP5553_10417 [Venustampulla echinocandica]RDL30139.1 hypothetical protein BP5553_10417 [Venustampulla echinocandica]
MDIENAYMKNSTGIGAMGNLALTSQFPQRPSHGIQGKRIAVYANCIKVIAESNLSLTRYNIEATCLPPGRKLRSGGRENLSATNPDPTFPGKEELLHALNAVLAHYLAAHDTVTTMGGNKHYSISRSQQNAYNIWPRGRGIEAFRGFYQSVRPATGGLLLNVNVTNGIFLELISLDRLFPALGTGNKATPQKKMRLVRVKITRIAPKRSKKTGEEFPRIKTAAMSPISPRSRLTAQAQKVSSLDGR